VLTDEEAVSVLKVFTVSRLELGLSYHRRERSVFENVSRES
jgi:hypothetical protein